MVRHEPDCALVTSHHLTCTCGATTRNLRLMREAEGNPVPWAYRPFAELWQTVEELRADVDRGREP